jgi:transcriptional regulator with XRE-family HTH domain
MASTNNGRKPHPDDIATGRRLREIRMRRGVSQEKLGQKMGVTFQQIQKYEGGINRMGASRLIALAKILEVPVTWLLCDDVIDHDIRPLAPFSQNIMAVARDMETLNRQQIAAVAAIVTAVKSAREPAEAAA